MYKFTKIVLILQLLLSCSVYALDVKLNNIEITFNKNIKDTYAISKYIEELNSQIDVNIFRKNIHKSPIKINIYINRELDSNELNFSLKKNTVILELNDIKVDFFSNFKIRRQLAGSLILLKGMTSPKRERVDKVPAWILAAIENILIEKNRKKSIVSSNRQFPYLRYFLETEKFPDVNFTRTLNADTIGETELSLFREISRLYIELSKKYNTPNNLVLLNYIKSIVLEENSEDEAFLKNIVSNFEEVDYNLNRGLLVQEYFEKFAESFVWNSFNPRSHALTKIMIENFYTTEIFALTDDNQIDFTKKEKFYITDFGNIMKMRPDAKEIKDRKNAELFRIYQGSDIQVKRKINEIQKALNEFPMFNELDNSSNEKIDELNITLANAIENLKNELDFKIKIDEMLDNEYKKNVPLIIPIMPLLMEYDSFSEKIGEQTKKVLDDTENNF